MALIPRNSKNETDRKQERAAAEEEVLVREVDDAVRQDQYADFAVKYGRPLLGVLVIGLAAFGGYLYWQHRHNAALEGHSEQYVAALDQVQAGDLKNADSMLGELAREDGKGAPVAAHMMQAAIAQEQGRADDAVKGFAAVAANKAAPQAMRDLATVREVAAQYDKMKPEDVIARLKPLAVPGGAYFGSAGEMVAMAYLKQGKRKEAGALFGQLAKDNTLPESLRARTRQMAGVMGVDAIDDVDKVLEEMAGPAGPPQAPQGAPQ